MVQDRVDSCLRVIGMDRVARRLCRNQLASVLSEQCYSLVNIRVWIASGCAFERLGIWISKTVLSEEKCISCTANLALTFSITHY